MKAWLDRLPGWLAAGVLALGLGACDSDSVAVVENGEKSERLQQFLQAPDEEIKAGAHRPNDPHVNLSPQKMAQVALQHLDELREQLAFETLNSAIGKYPESAMLLSLRASLFLQKQQTALALADLNRAIDINPHDPILLTNRAQALRRFGRNEDALRDLDNAIELDQSFVAAYFNRGSLNFEARQYDLALADFDRSIELEPDAPAGYFNRASTFDALGERQRAISDLQTFLGLSPEESWAEIARDMLKQWDPDLS